MSTDTVVKPKKVKKAKKAKSKRYRKPSAGKVARFDMRIPVALRKKIEAKAKKQKCTITETVIAILEKA